MSARVDMCAIVRFVEDKTDKRYVIPVADITTSTSITRWFDKDDDDSSGIYAVQILKLAGKYVVKVHYL